jgi:hypothetical protein
MASASELARLVDSQHTQPIFRRGLRIAAGRFAIIEVAAVHVAAGDPALADLSAGIDGFLTDGTISAAYGAGLQPAEGDRALILFNETGDAFTYDLLRVFEP